MMSHVFVAPEPNAKQLSSRRSAETRAASPRRWRRALGAAASVEAGGNEKKIKRKKKTLNFIGV